ncbi:pyridoxamine 5'-phosphate oxidase [Amylibacter ulvae]|uniref:Pyridoxamine 5'-phosphate oxidase n=1 Tax=Paramylibacter ulvae TaxID=1651968 RepID=A0ABQ3D9H9_9RHOB|nr:pyridoxamine 5'-phosphate oxidase family protein [Amylibacter ulvae]GHA56604.1 pyridoxamine 5'-phosphate oxidase [Amylibacter ulvae]
MTIIQSVDELEKLYGEPSELSLRKVADHITPEYSKWIESSPFCAICTVGRDGADASPRGDIGQVVFELDSKTLALPDRHGNNRLDSLRNIVNDGRVALMMMTPKSTIVTRVNGRGEISIDPELLERFVVKGKQPKSVILIHVEEVYFQCSRAVMRAGLWKHEQWPDIENLPTMGQILAAQSDNEIDGDAVDKAWPERAKKGLW